MPGLKRPIHCAWDAPATRPPAICSDVQLQHRARPSSEDEPEADDRLEEEERDARDDVGDVEELVDRVRREQDEDEEDDVDPQAPGERLVFVGDRVRRAPDEDGRGGDADRPRQDRRPPAAVDAEAVVVRRPPPVTAKQRTTHVQNASCAKRAAAAGSPRSKSTCLRRPLAGREVAQTSRHLLPDRLVAGGFGLCHCVTNGLRSGVGEGCAALRCPEYSRQHWGVGQWLHRPGSIVSRRRRPP